LISVQIKAIASYIKRLLIITLYLPCHFHTRSSRKIQQQLYHHVFITSIITLKHDCQVL